MSIFGFVCVCVCGCVHCANALPGSWFIVLHSNQLHSPQRSFQKRNIRLARDNIVTVGIVTLSKIHRQHQSVIPPSAKYGVMYFIYIRNYRGRKTKRGDCSLEVVLWGTVCVFPVLCVCACVFVVHRRPIHHILFTVFLCESFACHYSFVL